MRILPIGEKRRLVLLVSVLLVAGFLCTSLIGYFVSASSVRFGIIANELPLTADNIYSEIQNDLVRPIVVSSVMAGDSFLRDWVLTGEEDAAAITKYLHEIRDRYRAVTAFFVSERTRTYYHADGILKQVREDEPRDLWYFRVRKMETPYELNVDPDLANRDAMTLFINYRVYDYHETFIGTVGLGLTINSARARIRDYQERFGRTVYFVDPDGRIVLASDETQVPEKNIHEREGLRDMTADALGKEGGSFQYRRGGDVRLLSVRYVDELKWFAFVERGEDEAMTDIRRALYVNLIIFVLTTSVVLAATVATVNRYQSRLERMASTDKLTGLFNRQAYEILFGQTLKEARRSARPMSIGLFDLDHFKTVNDRFGHLAGDRVLEMAARILRTSLRESDVACRWGGEEFLVLLKNCGHEDAVQLCEKLRRAIEAADFSGGADQPLRITVSAGVAELAPDEREEALVSRADQALYGAKNAGRNRVFLAPGPDGMAGGTVEPV